jgi:hypothetical protein
MQTQAMTRYAIVPSRGCYGSGSTVRALRVCRDRTMAHRLAARWTREYRSAIDGTVEEMAAWIASRDD